MSRDVPPLDPEPEEPAGDGNLQPTPPLVVVGWAAGGVIGGWFVRWLYDQRDAVPPIVSAAQPLALLLLAAILGYVAFATHRAVHVRRERLLPHQAVNRLVLARACAIAAALVGGGYLGYALTWIGDPAELADQRLVRSLLAAGASALAVVAALLLERACRVGGERL